MGADGVLSAQCEDPNGVYQSTSVNLDSYIGNDDGTLVFGRSGFAFTCIDIGYVQEFEPDSAFSIVGSCYDPAGKTHTTGINIILYVKKVNGPSSGAAARALLQRLSLGWFRVKVDCLCIITRSLS